MRFLLMFLLTSLASGQDMMFFQPDDSPLSSLGIDLAVDGGRVLTGSNSFLARVFLFDLYTGEELLRLEVDDEDGYGYAVDLHGDLAVVGGYWQNGSPTSVYVHDATTGEVLFELDRDEDGAVSFGYDVATDGTWIAASAPFDDEFGTKAGAVHVYDAATGQHVYKLVASIPTPGDGFGWSLDLRGGELMVGSANIKIGMLGKAYVFDLTTGQEILRIETPTGLPGDRFGRKVALADEWLVVGASSDGEVDPSAGAVYVFDREGSLLAKLMPDPPETFWPHFGEGLYVDGTRLIVGAHGVQEAYVYDLCTLKRIDKVESPQRGFLKDDFGYAVALLGERAIVGAPFAGGLGGVYAFGLQRQYPTLELDSNEFGWTSGFGYDVAMQGRYAVVGAPDASVDGGVSVFDVETGVELWYHELNGWNNDYAFGEDVDIDLPYIAVGSPGKASGGDVYVFDAKTGDLLQKLTSPGESYMDHFGARIAIGGGRVLVTGDEYDSISHDWTGIVYLFDVAIGALLQEFFIPTSYIALDLEGDLAVICADTWHVYDMSSGERLRELVPSGNAYVRSIDMRGDLVLIGAFNKVYLFNVHTGEELLNLDPSQCSKYDNTMSGFGESVALGRDHIAVGAPGAHCPESTSGAVFVFDLHTGEQVWMYHNRQYAQGAHLGTVAMDGATLVVAAPDAYYPNEMVRVFELSESPGTTYCSPARPNSTGQSAELRAIGSARASSNRLQLHVEQTPPGSWLYVLAGTERQVPPAKGAAQNGLCVGGDVLGLVDQTVKADAGGHAAIDLDLFHLTPTGPMIVPGDTWVFQVWYRDAGISGASNYSDALEVLFH